MSIGVIRCLLSNFRGFEFLPKKKNKGNCFQSTKSLVFSYFSSKCSVAHSTSSVPRCLKDDRRWRTEKWNWYSAESSAISNLCVPIYSENAKCYILFWMKVLNILIWDSWNICLWKCWNVCFSKVKGSISTMANHNNTTWTIKYMNNTLNIYI